MEWKSQSGAADVSDDLTLRLFPAILSGVKGDDLLLEQLRAVTTGLGKTFAPFCEVVLHDLRDPAHTVVAIENSLSGRSVGDPSTELGLARIADENHAQVIANYVNTFADGRRAKSTSIGIKGANGHYVAALCLNIEVSVFDGVVNMLSQFTRTDDSATPNESLDPANAESIRSRIDAFTAQRATTPRSLTVAQRRELNRELKASGCLDIRRSADVISRHLGVSRATVYADVR